MRFSPPDGDFYSPAGTRRAPEIFTRWMDWCNLIFAGLQGLDYSSGAHALLISYYGRQFN